MDVTDAPVKAAPRSRAKLAVNITLGLLFSAAFVWLVLKDVDWDRVSVEYTSMRWSYLIYYMLILGGAQAMRLWRWGLTIRTLAPVPWPRILAVGSVGNAAIFVLPARLGELVRPLLIVDGQDLNFGQSTATVVVERLIDGLTMSGILFATVLMLDPGVVPQKFIYSGYAAAAVFGGASAGLFLAALFFKYVRKPLEKLLGLFSQALAQKIIAVIEGFFGALQLLGNAKLVVSYMALTLGIWGASAVGMWVLFGAFPGSTAGLPLIVAFATLSVLVVGIMIPSGPATVGIFHWAVVFALGMFAVDESAGLLFATVLHLLISVINLAYGLVGWVAGGIDLTSALRRNPEPEEG